MWGHACEDTHIYKIVHICVCELMLGTNTIDDADQIVDFRKN